MLRNIADIFIWAWLCLRDRWRRRGHADLLERSVGPRRLRSWRWPRVRRQQLLKQPYCQWCGTRRKLEVHHIKPFHTYPQLEEDLDNLITLCENRGRCHYERGHLGVSWKFANPAVREQCMQHAMEAPHDHRH